MHNTGARLQRAARSNLRLITFAPASTAAHLAAAVLFCLAWCTWVAQAMAACHICVFSFVALWPCMHGHVLQWSRHAHMACTVTFALLAAPPRAANVRLSTPECECEESPPPPVPKRHYVFNACT